MEIPRLLIIEDAKDVAGLLKRGLSEEGFAVEHASTGEMALRYLREEDWNLVVLDLMLGDVPGETVLKFITQKIAPPPVLVLTARVGLEDKLSLFQLGCDDYMIKPFAFEELLIRVRALLRRSRGIVQESYNVADVELDASTSRLHAGNNSVSLTPKEFAILRVLVREPGRVISRKELLQSVWGFTQEPRTNFIEVHMTNLRKKLSFLGKERWLQTIRASGFLFAQLDDHGP